MSEKLIDRLKQALDRKIYGMPKEQWEAELAAGVAFMKKHFAKIAFNDIFNFLKQNAAGIAYTIESKLVGRNKTFKRTGEESFLISLGTVRASVELKEDHIAATITKGDPPDETRTLTFHATVQNGSIFLTRADSPMSIYPDDALGDILEAMIELVD
ncbi:hypothetical protein MYX64_02075 [Nitrospinae bacterium AH_259_B05_G02_I21]|nr:hypothetical protein [Nitrospinae bacterium AH_259_B05_G02_I21]